MHSALVFGKSRLQSSGSVRVLNSHLHLNINEGYLQLVKCASIVSPLVSLQRICLSCLVNCRLGRLALAKDSTLFTINHSQWP